MILIWQHGTTENRSAYCRFVVACTAFFLIVSQSPLALVECLSCRSCLSSSFSSSSPSFKMCELLLQILQIIFRNVGLCVGFDCLSFWWFDHSLGYSVGADAQLLSNVSAHQQKQKDNGRKEKTKERQCHGKRWIKRHKQTSTLWGTCKQFVQIADNCE